MNEFLGGVKADMPESELKLLAKEVFPEAEICLGRWSGGTGYIEVQVTDGYTISIAEYDTREKANISRFVHPDRIFMVHDANDAENFRLSMRGRNQPPEPKHHD